MTQSWKFMDLPLGWLRCHINVVCILNEHSNGDNFTIIDDGRELSINLLEAVWKVWFILSMNKLQVHAAIVHHIRVYYTDFCSLWQILSTTKACVCVQWVVFTIISYYSSCCKKSTSPLVLVKYKVYSYCCNCGFTITIFKIFLPSLFYKLP